MVRKLRILLAAGAMSAAAAMAAPASALTITMQNANLPLPVGQTMLVDFDNPNAAGFTFTQDVNAFVRSGALGLLSGVSAPPPGDTTNYETVTSGGRATMHANGNALKVFSVFMGSPDSYNSIRFTGLNGYSQTLSGAAIFNNQVNANGNQSVGRRVTYDFGNERVTKVEFLSSGNSFEFDALAGTAVPEPGVWAMMITGFGLAGAFLRRRRAALQAA